LIASALPASLFRNAIHLDLAGADPRNALDEPFPPELTSTSMPACAPRRITPISLLAFDAKTSFSFV